MESTHSNLDVLPGECGGELDVRVEGLGNRDNLCRKLIDQRRCCVYLERTYIRAIDELGPILS